ncbi:MAG: transposase [Candidatus Nitrosocosmicus sp.]
MTGSNPTADRTKLGTKRHILTDKNGVPLSTAIITSANKHDIKAITDVIDNAVIKRPPSSSPPKRYNRKRNKHHYLYVLIKHTTPNL